MNHIVDMIGWLIQPQFVNPATAVSRCILTLLCIRFVHLYATTLIAPERIGLGLMGGSSVLTILAVYDPSGPTAGWSHAILGIGALIYVAGNSVRYTRHSERNRRMIEEKMMEMRAKGIRP